MFHLIEKKNDVILKDKYCVSLSLFINNSNWNTLDKFELIHSKLDIFQIKFSIYIYIFFEMKIRIKIIQNLNVYKKHFIRISNLQPHIRKVLFLLLDQNLLLQIQCFTMRQN